MDTASAFDQARYQVRFDWGAAGVGRLAPADVIVVVDVLHFPIDVLAAVARDGRSSLGAHTDAAAVAELAASRARTVLVGALRNASAVARAIADLQKARAERTSVSIIAAGDSASGSARFAVEDLLGAGAIVDALGATGIDHTSPEAAAACEAFRGLRGAVRHLLTASGSGQAVVASGGREAVLEAASIDVDDVVPVLRDGSFVAY